MVGRFLGWCFFSRASGLVGQSKKIPSALKPANRAVRQPRNQLIMALLTLSGGAQK